MISQTYLTQQPEMVFQGEVAECGLACIVMLIDALGGQISLEKLREKFPVSVAGSSLLQLSQIAGANGVNMIPVRLGEDALKTIPLPAILHYGGDHFVLCTQRIGNAVRVFNPATGPAVIPIEQLKGPMSGYALILDTSRQIPSFCGASKGGLKKDVWAGTRLSPFWLLVIATVSAGVLGFVVPVLYAMTLDGTSPLREFGVVAPFVGALFIAILSVFVKHLSVVRQNVGAQAVMQERMTELFNRLLRKPLVYFERRILADIIQRFMTHGRLVAQRGVTEINLWRAALMTLCTLTIMIWIDFRLCLITAGAILCYGVANRYFLMRRVPLLLHFEELSGRNTDSIFESLSGISTVATTGLHATRSLNFSESQTVIASVSLRLADLDSQQNSIDRIIGYIESISVLMVGAALVQGGTISVAGLISFVFFKQIGMDSVTDLYSVFMHRREQDVVIQRSQDLIDGEDDQFPASSMPLLREELYLSSLSFSYPAGATFGFDALNIRVGEKIALVGASGCGKSTCLKLISGLYQSANSIITLDGTPIPTEVLRSLVHYQLAAPSLFRGTVMDNILLPGSIGYEKKSRSHAVALLQAIGLHDRILGLPHGWKTELTMTNPQLSSGQLQRLMVVRALCSQRPLIVFDEPTSNLDEHSALNTFEAILSCPQAVIVATHETAYLQRFDRVLEMRDGRIWERSRGI